MGRYSVRLAPEFAAFAGIAADQRVLDVGAGTGALTAEIVSRTEPKHVAAAEPSAEFVAALRARLPGVDVKEAPAEQLPWPDGAFDAALAQLVVSFMADAPAGVAEMRRVVRGGGVVAACVWTRDQVEMLSAIDRARLVVAPDTPERSGQRFRGEGELADLLEGAGLREIASTTLDVEATYTGFDDFWNALDAGVGPAGEWVNLLNDEQRAALPDELYRQLGEPAGEFTLH